VTDADLITAIAARQDAWRQMDFGYRVLGDLCSRQREWADILSARFRKATQTVVEGLRERRGIFEHEGSTFLLNEDGDGFVCSDKLCTYAGDNRNLAENARRHLAKLRDLNARRFRQAREGVA
jgi:hypothetical protein